MRRLFSTWGPGSHPGSYPEPQSPSKLGQSWALYREPNYTEDNGFSTSSRCTAHLSAIINKRNTGFVYLKPSTSLETEGRILKGESECKFVHETHCFRSGAPPIPKDLKNPGIINLREATGRDIGEALGRGVCQLARPPALEARHDRAPCSSDMGWPALQRFAPQLPCPF